MIIGHGIDIVDLRRFRLMNDERLKKIANRICTDFEIKDFESSNLRHQYLAKIWAGKESIAKAFGTGIQGDMTWKQIQIQSNELGRPSVWFKERLAGPVCHLSFSHERDYLIASAILEII
jgi:holo-[acyl-carrier protein] synthase